MLKQNDKDGENILTSEYIYVFRPNFTKLNLYFIYLCIKGVCIQHTSLKFVLKIKTYFKGRMHGPLWTHAWTQNKQHVITVRFGHVMTTSSITLFQSSLSNGYMADTFGLSCVQWHCGANFWLCRNLSKCSLNSQLHSLSCFWYLLANNWTTKVQQPESSDLSSFFLLIFQPQTFGEVELDSFKGWERKHSHKSYLCSSNN